MCLLKNEPTLGIAQHSIEIEYNFCLLFQIKEIERVIPSFVNKNRKKKLYKKLVVK